MQTLNPPPKKNANGNKPQQGSTRIAITGWYRGADESLAWPTSQCILFDGKNISFDASLVIYIKIVLIFLQLW